MLQNWHQHFPGRIESMSKALQNVVPSHLADNAQFNFVDLKTQTIPFENGDIGFDPPELSSSDMNKFEIVAPIVITNI